MQENQQVQYQQDKEVAPDGTSPYSENAQQDAANAVAENMPDLPQQATSATIVQPPPGADMSAPPGQVPQYMQQMLKAQGVPVDQIQPPPPRRPPRAPPQAPSLEAGESQPAAQHPLGLNGEGLDTSAPSPDDGADGADGGDGDAGSSSDPLRMPDGTEDTALLPDGTPNKDRIASAMADQLAQKLEENPKQISNPQLYDMTQNPLIKTQMDAAMAAQNPDYLGSNAGIQGNALGDYDAVPENMPVSSGGAGPAAGQLSLDPSQIPSVGDVLNQNGFVPGMLSTIQTGSRIHSHGTSRKF
jgi:hypothetical protein